MISSRDGRTTWARLVCDLVALGALFIIFIGAYVAANRGVVVRRGFFCDDESIKLPYMESTVPTWALALGSLGVPLLMLILGSVWERYGCWPRPETHLGSLKVCYWYIPPWILRLGFQMRWFFTGLLVTLVITDIGKLVVGRLRPHFLDVCNPNFSSINCTDEHGYKVYVTEYECRGDPSLVAAARLSWPSGHSSISAYAFIFLALYISSVSVFYQRSGLKLFAMLVAFLLAFLTALSRISDHKHHPTDVLSGFIIGAAVAIGIVYYNLSFFGRVKNQLQYKEEHENPLLSQEGNASQPKPPGENHP